MLPHAFNLTVDVLIRYRDIFLFDHKPFIGTEFNLRALRKCRCKDDILALFECHNIDLWTRDRLHILLCQSLFKRILGNSFKCFL